MDIGKDLQSAYDEGYKQGRFDEKVESKRWIPVSERLPEEGLTVLTYDAQEDIEFGEYNDGKWYWLLESGADYWAENKGVLAWMPLPEPYKGGDTE